MGTATSYLRSAYAAGGTWSVILQPSDQIPSQVDWDGSTLMARGLLSIGVEYMMLI